MTLIDISAAIAHNFLSTGAMLVFMRDISIHANFRMFGNSTNRAPTGTIYPTRLVAVLCVKFFAGIIHILIRASWGERNYFWRVAIDFPCLLPSHPRTLSHRGHHRGRVSESCPLSTMSFKIGKRPCFVLLGCPTGRPFDLDARLVKPLEQSSYLRIEDSHFRRCPTISTPTSFPVYIAHRGT